MNNRVRGALRVFLAVVAMLAAGAPVWPADNPGRQSQALLFARSLPDMRGIPFVHEQTTPHFLDIIRSEQPARAVLEIAGGEARRLGLHPGPQVVHPALASH